jgi:hypothetical protein
MGIPNDLEGEQNLASMDRTAETGHPSALQISKQITLHHENLVTLW